MSFEVAVARVKATRDAPVAGTVRSICRVCAGRSKVPRPIALQK